MKFPVLKLIVPTDLAGERNGSITEAKMASLLSFPQGRLHRLAATAYNAMQLSAFFAGIELRPTSSADCYRTFAQQERTFRGRYTPVPNGSRVTRTWQGQRWYLMPGKAPSAAPGTSNHGWGLAVDIANCSGTRLNWLLGDGFATSNALKFGFSWEVASGPNAEAWHLRYVCGDKLPQAVIDAIAVFPEIDAR